MSEKPVPTITLKLLQPESFKIEIDWTDCPSVNLVRAMLAEGVEAVKKHIADLEAAEFGAKMNAAASAHRAMQKMPKLV